MNREKMSRGQNLRQTLRKDEKKFSQFLLGLNIEISINSRLAKTGITEESFTYVDRFKNRNFYKIRPDKKTLILPKATKLFIASNRNAAVFFSRNICPSLCVWVQVKMKPVSLIVNPELRKAAHGSTTFPDSFWAN